MTNLELTSTDGPPRSGLRLSLFGPMGQGASMHSSGSVTFDIDAGKGFYFSSSSTRAFKKPPPEGGLPLEPGTEYQITCSCSTDNNSIALYFFEYRGEDLINRSRHRLSQGTNCWQVSTEQFADSWVIALRLSGTGSLTLHELSIDTANRFPFGPEAQFRRPSIFYDPAGFAYYEELHHTHYEARRPDWYAKWATEITPSDRVLDLGCGPGLFLRYLKDNDVENLVGLERDPIFLEICRQNDIPVIEHDLNLPPTFLASHSFDRITAIHSFDYLTPIALRGTLRECKRLLKENGSLTIALRVDGQESGDQTRTSRYSLPLLRRLLSEAGLETLDVSEERLVIHATVVPATPDMLWPVEHRAVNPFLTPKPLLSNFHGDSARDFTLLSTPDKSDVLENGEHVAFFTGYLKVAGETQRSVFRATSRDGDRWSMTPDTPVIEADPTRKDCATGLATGSVIEVTSGRSRFQIYLSGRDSDNRWSTIFMAFSEDGIYWEQDPTPILTTADFPGLRHIALADVIRSTEGTWYMHLEGTDEKSRRWGIYQATSQDGLKWVATPEPVVRTGQLFGWEEHIANPKCCELEPGRFLLGCNVAGSDRRFQITFAESKDLTNWVPVGMGPVIPAPSGIERLESAFFTRQSLASSQRLFLFGSTSQNTAASSGLLRSDRDHSAYWLGAPWRTPTPGLAIVRDQELVLESRVHAIGEATLCSTIERDTQITFALRGDVNTTLTLTGHGSGDESRVSVDATRLSINNTTISDFPADVDEISVVARIYCPDSIHCAIEFVIWANETLIAQKSTCAGHGVCSTKLVFSAHTESGGRVSYANVWQPDAISIEPPSDAHMYFGPAESQSPVMLDLPDNKIPDHLDQQGVYRAFVMPFGSDAKADNFAALGEIAKDSAGRLLAFFRRRYWHEGTDADREFQTNQLELLWQLGRLQGLKIHMGLDEIPPLEVLEWVQSRQVPTMWHVCNTKDLDWLQKHVLERFDFPVLLSHFGGYPLDRNRYERAIALLRHPQLYLVTSVVFFQAYLALAVNRAPNQILVGSDHPMVAPSLARSAIENLEISDSQKALVLGENLRLLAEKQKYVRREILRSKRTRFPPLPETPGDLEKQGFKIVPPETYGEQEFSAAKDYWADYGVRRFYQEYKPWTRYLADMVSSLNPKSVFEFGCNRGRNLAYLHARESDRNYLGLDINESAIRAGIEETGLDLRYGDERTLAEMPDDSVDFIFTISVLDHMSEIDTVCNSLLRVCRRNLFLLEVTLPVEGRCDEHFDHRAGETRQSTGASYSWNINERMKTHPNVERIESTPMYLHAASLGPYYSGNLIFKKVSAQ